MAREKRMPLNERAPLLIILSGPSGVGKDAVLESMKRTGCPLYYVTTVTTRPRRKAERDGVDYCFVSDPQFRGMVERGEMLEWAEVYRHSYGVPKAQIRQALGRGEDVMVKVDVQGAATIKRLVPQAVAIFVAPPSLEELETRLRRRKTESSVDLELRLKNAREEMETLPAFDYVVVNHKDGVDVVVAQISAIITSEKCRASPRGKIALS